MTLMGRLFPKLEKEEPAPKQSSLSQKDQAVVMLIAAVLLGGLAIVVAIAVGGSNGSGQLSVATCSKQFTLQSQYNCFDELANSTHNMSICTLLPSVQSPNCAFEVATGSRNISACTATYNVPTVYQECILSLANTTTNYKYCNGLKATAAFKCVYEVAKENSFASANTCAALTNTSIAAGCSALNNYINAVAQRSTSYCDALQSSPNVTSLAMMLQNYSAQRQYNASSNITRVGLQQSEDLIGILNVSPRDYCYYQLAKMTGNSGLCGYTTTKEGSVLCQAAFAQPTTTIVSRNQT